MRLRPRREGEGSSRQREEDFDDEYVPDSYSDDSSDSGDKTKDFLRSLERSNGGHYVDDSDSDLGDDEPVMKRPKGKSKPKKSLKENEDIWLEKQEPNVTGQKGINAVVLEESFGVNQVHYNKKWKRKKREGPPLIWEIWEEENERWLDENMSKCHDLENRSEIMHSMAEPSSELIIPLLRYQKEWLAWALEREESSSRGGILADEMGMGKTIQAIALVLAKREILRAISGPSKPLLLPTTSTTLPEINCTLVICPVVAVMQWVGEIDRFTSKGSTKVLVYHGANRGKIVQQFADYDLVITTYSIVESEYRKNVLPPKEKCSWCGKLFYPEKMTIHLKYFCGPDAVRTEKQSKQTRKKAKHGPKTSKKKMESEDEGVKSKGGKRKGVSKKNNKQYSCEEEVIPSLGCLEGVQEGSSQKQSLLHSLKWERIILDEAHFIKDRRCSTAKSIFALHSSFKWALSGTPLQNRVGELYSLIRFLRINPYSFYLCKDCDCSILDYCSTKECSKCPHKSVRHFCWWNKYVATPIKENGSMVNGKRAMILLKDKVLKSIVLRRTKKGRAADLALPPTIISLRRDLLDIKEEDYYKSLYNESQAQFNTYVEAGTLMNNYAHIFDLLTRLRQAVDHPYLVVYSRTTALKNGSTIETDNNENVCGICHDTLEDPVVSSCEHAFCKACLIELSTDSEQVSCPSCSKPLTVDLTTKVGTICKNSRTAIKGFRSTSILNRIPLDDFQTSTKIEALREEIRFMFERDGSAKAIVFSQFTSFLDLINYSLQKSGVACVQLVGSMTMAAREDAIKKFTDDPDCRIFLMSLKAGGVALNLTVASHVFLMDPWWNPAVERQARDRIHRIGQFKPIRVVRFVIENTVEERILKLQDKKELVFEGTVGGSMEALGKLTEADMKFLFIT